MGRVFLVFHTMYGFLNSTSLYVSSFFQGLCTLHYASRYNWSNERAHSERLFCFSRQAGLLNAPTRVYILIGCSLFRNYKKNKISAAFIFRLHPFHESSCFANSVICSENTWGGELHLLLLTYFHIIDSSFKLQSPLN